MGVFPEEESKSYYGKCRAKCAHWLAEALLAWERILQPSPQQFTESMT